MDGRMAGGGRSLDGGVTVVGRWQDGDVTVMSRERKTNDINTVYNLNSVNCAKFGGTLLNSRGHGMMRKKIDYSSP